MTQNEEVLEWLKEFGNISSREAVYELNIFRLSARILDLKEMGHNITSEPETCTNRKGKKSTYARYTLHTGVNPTESTPYSPEYTLEITEEEEEQLAAWDRQEAEERYNYDNPQGELL
jgi:hypothetical protein